MVRSYRSLFERQLDEFRVYVIEGKMRGMCQKNPSFLSGKATMNQITKGEEISQLVSKKMEKSQKEDKWPQ